MKNTRRCVIIMIAMIALAGTAYADIIGSVSYMSQFRYQTRTFDCFLINAQNAELEIRATPEQMKFVEEKKGWISWSLENAKIPVKTYNSGFAKDFVNNKIITKSPPADDSYSGLCNATITVNFAAIDTKQIPYLSYPLIIEGTAIPRCETKWRCIAGISVYQNADCTFSNRTSCPAQADYNPSGLCNENTGLCPTPETPWPSPSLPPWPYLIAGIIILYALLRK